MNVKVIRDAVGLTGLDNQITISAARRHHRQADSRQKTHQSLRILPIS